MAEVVLGVGTSHSPMVCMIGPDWLAWGENDHTHPGLFTREGRHVDYEEAVRLAGPEMLERITPDACDMGAARVETAVARLREEVTAAELDVLVVLGDDQSEHLLSKNLPPFLVYWGDTIENRVHPGLDDMAPHLRRFLPWYGEVDGDRDYPVEVGLARHIIDTMQDNAVDVATSDSLPEDRGMGHAFSFPLRYIAQRTDLPVVPVMVNTYNPPAQPRATRCATFGRVLRQAVDSYPADLRVGLLASGGLSHFIVLEDLDREVLAALERNDLDSLCSIPEATLQSGTSEIKNWISLAAALDDMSFTTIDYVPGLRTPGGTGTGLAFGVWKP